MVEQEKNGNRHSEEVAEKKKNAKGARKKKDKTRQGDSFLVPYLSYERISSSSTGSHALCSTLFPLSAVHTAELHLNPLPNAICHTRSPLRTPAPRDSMRARMYQMEDEDVLPYRRSVSRDGATAAEGRRSCFSISSMTPRPPVWMQKWSNAVVKSGV